MLSFEVVQRGLGNGRGAVIGQHEIVQGLVATAARLRSGRSIRQAVAVRLHEQRALGGATTTSRARVEIVKVVEQVGRLV